jgi:hypothetical protein
MTGKQITRLIEDCGLMSTTKMTELHTVAIEFSSKNVQNARQNVKNSDRYIFLFSSRFSFHKKTLTDEDERSQKIRFCDYATSV